MDWHAFVVFGGIFCVCHIRNVQSVPVVEVKIREERSPQNNAMFAQPNVNGGVNIQDVASNVRKRLHDLVDSVTNPLIGNVMGFSSPEANYEQYDYDYQQYSGPRFEHGRPGGPPPRRFHPRGPPPGGHHRGPPPPHGPPPHGPPPYGPPHHGPPPHGPPPHGPPPHFPGPPPHHHGPPPRGPPPPFPPPDTSPPEGFAEEETENSWDTRPNFSDQPNYPLQGNSSSATTSINLDEKSPSTKEASNVAGYIENNFPVILLTENEIRRR